MTIQLYSVDHAPRRLPDWETVLDDLGRPSPAKIARTLGVGVSTVYRWSASGRPPRSALLALFWLTRWGRSAVHVQATNDAIMACGYVECMRREIRRLEGNVRHLVALSSGAANDPVQQTWLHAPGVAVTRQPGQAASVKTVSAASVNSGRVSGPKGVEAVARASVPQTYPLAGDVLAEKRMAVRAPAPRASRKADQRAGEAGLDLSPGHFSTQGRNLKVR